MIAKHVPNPYSQAHKQQLLDICRDCDTTQLLAEAAQRAGLDVAEDLARNTAAKQVAENLHLEFFGPIIPGIQTPGQQP